MKPVIVEGQTYELPRYSNYTFEMLTQVLPTLRFDSKLEVKVNDFVIELNKRRVSKVTAQKPKYAYSGTIRFLYGPNRVVARSRLTANASTSLLQLVRINETLIRCRLKQHFEDYPSSLADTNLAASMV